MRAVKAQKIANDERVKPTRRQIKLLDTALDFKLMSVYNPRKIYWHFLPEINPKFHFQNVLYFLKHLHIPCGSL